MIPEGIVTRVRSDALFDCNVFGGGAVCYPDVHETRGEVVNRDGSVRTVPGNFERIGAVVDRGFDKGVGKGWGAISGYFVSKEGERHMNL